MSHLWFVIRWLHLLAMTFFVGGQMMLAAIVLPVGRGADDRESLRTIARRFGYGTLVALLVLLATGTAMAFHFELWSNGTFHIKLALVALVGALLIWHVRRPNWHVLEAIVFLFSLTIMWIGLYLANGYS
jgi:4-hydroxybenzoate polyprenyltransferase